MKFFRTLPGILALFSMLFFQCDEHSLPPTNDDDGMVDPPADLIFGADLSYVNQILDHGGVYMENDVVKDPYTIFAEHGTELVRLRLWHNPAWTQTVYDPPGTQLYNDLADVEKALESVKANGMEALLDFHYSDNWADPGNQHAPEAWEAITDIEVLKDSIYNYTFNTLDYLKSRGLIPEYVQLGNEINCGLFHSEPAGFPNCDNCNGGLANLQAVLNSAIQAVRAVEPTTKIILHIAEPRHVEWWFDNITTGVSDFDIIGISYYPIWHTETSVGNLSTLVESFSLRYAKNVMIMEVAYPWTTETNDSYSNLFSSGAIAGYEFTPEGQLALMTDICQEVIDGGGLGVVYWEPAWITSEMKTQWGTGSAWENNAFFDYDGNLNQAIDYMTHEYQ